MNKLYYLIPIVIALLIGCKPPLPKDFNSLKKDANKPSVNKEWVQEGIRITGKYADADIVRLGDGTYRMYYSVEPEVKDNKLEMHSALSKDGLKWKQEPGIRNTFKTFADAIRLPDNKWRMYYQTFKGIQSSVSSDGLNWNEEAGVRIKPGLEGKYDTTQVADSTTIQLPDGTYLMVYRGSAFQNEYGEKDMNGKIKPNDYLIKATSKNGLNWEEAQMIVDSEDDEFRGQALGPDIVFDGNQLNLYYWSFPGVYIKSSTDNGKTWSEQQKIIEAKGGPNQALFVPGDPTVIKQGTTWRMYFGIHTKGIYSASME